MDKAKDNSGTISIGMHAIIEQLDLKIPRPFVRSVLAAGTRKTRITDSEIVEQYPKSYRPAEGLAGHLRFALRYEPVDLGVYNATFARIPKSEIEPWIQSEPNGAFARRAWYLYEFLTGITLDLEDLTSGPYVDLLDTKIHMVGPVNRIRRQRVFENLMGNKQYCPLVRRSEKIEAGIAKNLTERARALVAAVDPAVLKRAVHYLFTKETKSSFAIEGEEPSKDRTERFVASLMRADKFDPTLKRSLVELQNAIVDARYAEKDWRDLQVYIGETLPDFSQQIHFACPKPGDVSSLMDGWMTMIGRLVHPDSGVHPVCAAAAAAFGLVFVHPFVDGNGRIHRFLVHNVLSKTGFTPPGMVFPVSAAMLRDLVAYDRALEAFSEALAPFVQYTLDGEQKMTVANQTRDLYRFFDATPQAEYLYACIEQTIGRDLNQELNFLKFFDAAMKAVMSVVDMPNQRASLLIRLIHQNKGRLSKEKRDSFSELSDEEIGKIEAAIKVAAQQFQPAEVTSN
ncbi:MAG TPA: Fic family protein [Candidatus Sulfotelmatobacter sp.]|nr:Fic family protein [Candidatus Sulfotelmatobacter sp.]